MFFWVRFLSVTIPIAMLGCGEVYETLDVDTNARKFSGQTLEPTRITEQQPVEILSSDVDGTVVLSAQMATVRRNPRDVSDPQFDEDVRTRAVFQRASEEVLDRLSQVESISAVELFIRCDTPLPTLSGLEGLDFDVRGAEFRVLREDSLEQLAGCREAVQQLGARFVSYGWLAGGVFVRVPSLEIASELVGHDLVIGASWSSFALGETAYGGIQLRDQTGTTFLAALGYHGEDGGRVTTPDDNVKIGIIDSGGINSSHVAWRDYADGVCVTECDCPGAGGTPCTSAVFDCVDSICVGPTRLLSAVSCYSGGCTADAAATDSATSTHANKVAGVAASDITQGQRGGVTAVQAADRSGVSREASIRYYRLGGSTGSVFHAAWEQAIEDGVDVAVSATSLEGATGGWCDRESTGGGMESTLRTALTAGLVSVFSAGNAGVEGSCRTLWPGHRPEAIAVGGVDTSVETVSYNDTVRDPASSYGTMDAGDVGLTSTVDLMAPYDLELSLGTGTRGYQGAISGTSFSAPIVAGMVANTKAMLKSLGMSGSGRMVLGTMLLFGDRSDGLSANGVSSRFSARTGGGRAQSHVLTSDYLGAPWGFGHAEPLLGNGDVWSIQHNGSGPESTSVTMFRWVVLPLDAFSGDTNFLVELWDTCPLGNGADILVASDYTYNQVKRIQISGTSYGGRCLEARIRVVSGPTANVRFISTSVYFSGSPTSRNS